MRLLSRRRRRDRLRAATTALEAPAGAIEDPRAGQRSITARSSEGADEQPHHRTTVSAWTSAGTEVEDHRISRQITATRLRRRVQPPPRPPQVVLGAHGVQLGQDSRQGCSVDLAGGVEVGVARRDPGAPEDVVVRTARATAVSGSGGVLVGRCGAPRAGAAVGDGPDRPRFRCPRRRPGTGRNPGHLQGHPPYVGTHQRERSGAARDLFRHALELERSEHPLSRKQGLAVFGALARMSDLTPEEAALVKAQVMRSHLHATLEQARRIQARTGQPPAFRLEGSASQGEVPGGGAGRTGQVGGTSGPGSTGSEAAGTEGEVPQ